MLKDFAVGPLCAHTVESEHDDEFYINECKFILLMLEGRLRNVSLKPGQENLNATIEQALYDSEHFNDVWISTDNKVYLERRRGRMIVFIRLKQLFWVKKSAHRKYHNSRLRKKSKRINIESVPA